MKKIFVFLISLLLVQVFATVDNSVIPWIEMIEFPDEEQRLRVMSYNMLYNERKAEAKLPIKHRWPFRRPRLLEYLDFANADMICSQELQENQVKELSSFLKPHYDCYGLKIREGEGRSDVNAIFFKSSRFELLNAKTIFYENVGGNGFAYCLFRDRLFGNTFVVLNTKLSWGFGPGAMKKRLLEARKLQRFVSSLSSDIPILLMGDFNTLHFLDGKRVVEVLTKRVLKDGKSKSLYGHFGPFCSITNSRFLFTPFTGPELKGFVLDRIFVNDRVVVISHAIDTAKVNGEYASDHFPVIADLVFIK